MPYSLRRALFGSPMATSRMAHERIGPAVGLAVFSADALSSVAYGTEEVLLALVLAGSAGLQLSMGPAAAIAILICIVAFSYRQTIMKYPDGGGAYIVAHDNLGQTAGLMAAAALLIDYTLTVAVSVTSGVAAVISAFPQFAGHRIAISLFMIAFVALVNLRGTRESGLFFAIPTYAFIVGMLGLIGAGLYHGYTQPYVSFANEQWLREWAMPPHTPLQGVTFFLLVRAFASGCAALTGIEAVANGVRAFREPSAINANKVMTILAVLLFTMFIGVSWLAHYHHIVPSPSQNETVISQIARGIFGRGLLYYAIQVATAMILFIAVNTSFAGFPRLASLLARDGYLPRQLANLGDRLVFNNGILVLAIAAIFLVVIFGGLTHSLIPLYAVGVFLAFTLSQAGMVTRWYRRRESGWKAGIVINSIGALTTLVVLVVVMMAKFTAGAWMVVILLPVMVIEFRAIHRHYSGVADLLRIDKIEKLPVHPTKVIVPVAGLHRGVLRALRFAAGLNTETVAIHVGVDEVVAEKLKRQWAKLEVGVPLVVLDSPYRSLVAPLLDYVDEALAKTPDGFVAVVIPEFVPQHWRHSFLHNQSALLLEFALRSRPNAVLISIRYLLGQAAREARLQLERETCRLADLPAPKPPTDTPPATDAPSAPETPAEAPPEPQPVEPPPCDDSVAAGWRNPC